jgi:ABC-type Zn uptake system ZnuABC Zn-binding protein ZnuA
LVVATTPDLKSITEAVTGGAVRVESLVPPGSDAEAFEPRPSHLALVKDAVLTIRVGLGYDDWLDRLIAQSGNARVQRGTEAQLDLSKDVALLEVQGRSVEQQAGHAHGAANPHYWLDPANAEPISAVIAEAVVRVAPEKRGLIEAAQNRFRAELKARLEHWTRALEPHRGAPIVVYHNSWPYFARRFRLNIVDVIEPKEGVPPTAARLLSLAATIRSKKVRVIVHEPFEPIDASRSLSERTGARVVVLAPSVGGTPGTETYFELFDRNVDLLAKALAGEP